MSPQNLKRWPGGAIVLLVVLVVPAGCNGPPPAPPNAAHAGTPNGVDPYDGWAFNRLVGRTPPGAQPTGAPNGASVQPGGAAVPGQPVGAGGAPGGPGNYAPQGVGFAPPANNVIPASASEPLPPGANGPGPILPPLQAPPQVNVPPPGEPTVVSPPTGKPEEDTGWDWSKLAPENVWKGIKKAAGYGPEERLARAAFQEGEALFRDKKYEEAAAKFYTASWRWPDSTMEEDSLFLLGECYFFTDQYSKAHDTFTNLLKKHENTRYLDTVMHREFAIGRYWEQMDIKSPHWVTTPNVSDKTRPMFDTFGNALAAYQAVWLHDPTGPLADSAIMASANAHFRKGRWEEAAQDYDRIRKEYPKSRFQQEAHILGLQSKLKLYQGAMYDGTPLNDAKEIADQALTQFRGRMGEEEGRIRETRSRIIEQQAEKEWAWGRYYDSKRYYGSARLYYKYLVEHYPTTRYAEQARQRLQQIQNEPDEPPNRFKWLTRLLPEATPR